MSSGNASLVPSGMSAVVAIAQLTLIRFLRSKTIFVASVLALLPLVPLLVGAGKGDPPEENWENFLGVAAYMQLLVAALLMAPVIAEEIDDKTYTYLWSRPIPRWSVLFGKLLVGGLLAVGMMSICLVVGSQIAHIKSPGLIATALAAFAIGVFAAGSIAACFGTLLPKHPLAVSISYLLVLDFGIGAMPFAISRISVMHNVIALSGHGPHANTLATSLAWLMGITVFWTAITLWRLGRKELSTGS